MIQSGYILLFGTFLASISQVMLKKAALQTHETKWAEYLNPICAYFIFFATTFLSILAYKHIPLSMGPMLETTGYIYVTIFGVTIFREKVNFQKLLALALIIGGISVYTLVG